MNLSRENQPGDFFEQLPDEIVLEIFNKVGDAKSLVRGLSVSKRFNAIIPQVESVSLRLPRRRAAPAAKPPPAKLFKALFRLLRGISAAGKRKDDKRRDALFYSPSEALRGFGGLKSLRVELPRCGKGEAGLAGKDSVLKWKADFGAGLRSCVILGANSVRKETGLRENDGKDQKNDGQTALTDEELKARIVWMISSLIAASARHHLTKRVVSSFPELRSVVVSDGDRRGVVHTRGDELGELRTESSVESSLERSLIPDLGIRLWYVPRLVLHRCGCVMEGATLVVIRPLDCERSDGGDGELLGCGEGFDGDEDELEILGEAVSEMVKMKKTYVMEMTSF